MFKEKLTIREILIGITLGYLSYILIAIFNISNEDIYNWDVGLIFSQGGFTNSAALIAFWLWCVITLLWGASVVFRVVKLIFYEK